MYKFDWLSCWNRLSAIALLRYDFFEITQDERRPESSIHLDGSQIKSGMTKVGGLIALFFVTNAFAQTTVRVLLAEGLLVDTVSWQFATSKNSFVCTFSEGSLLCNGKKLPQQAVRIRTEDGRCSYQNAAYAGQLSLVIQDDRWYIVNHLSLDDYVYSVLRSESWPGWPLEVNKVFAIMVRTYVVHRIMTKNRKKKLYDIKATNIHQTYKGLHEFEHLHQAVRDTHDIIIAHNKRPILAMYDSCCGGVVPAQITGFDFKEHPYLARPYACQHCSDCKIFSWKIVYKPEKLLKLLQEEFPEITVCKEVAVSLSDSAGKVLEISVKNTHQQVKIPGPVVYRLCKDIRSFCYTVHKEHKNIVFTGKGFGHHMGICQWGVRAMEKKGFDYKQMIHYYYPGTSLMKLVAESNNATT